MFVVFVFRFDFPYNHTVYANHLKTIRDAVDLWKAASTVNGSSLDAGNVGSLVAEYTQIERDYSACLALLREVSFDLRKFFYSFSLVSFLFPFFRLLMSTNTLSTGTGGRGALIISCISIQG